MQNGLKGISDDLQNRRISSVELTTELLHQIDRHAAFNAFITVDRENALQAAQLADENRAMGNGSPFSGVPIGHKDLFCTQGLRTTCGSKMLEKFVAPYDATVVARCRAAGLVNLGKLNLDEFAMGSSNETSYFGPVRNPWHADYVAGGSSGGSAAAVALDLVAAATATDTGGSIRLPAAFCGVTGLKPTYGRVSRFGMVAYASSLDQAGWMARRAEDIALLLPVISGFDERDSTSAPAEVAAPLGDLTATLQQPLTGLRIGLPRRYFGEGLTPAVGECVHQALALLEQQGAVLVDLDLPNDDLAIAVYYVIASAEASSNLARFDGVRYGYRCANPQDLADLYTRSRSEGFGEEVKRRILIGTYVLSAGYYDAYYKRAQQARRRIAEDFAHAFSQVDVIAGPTAPTTAFALGAKTQDPVAMYLSDVYTVAVNLAGLPALSLPVGLVDGLPVGMQLIGPAWQEARLLQVAHQYQQVTDWHLHRPPILKH